MAAGKLVSIILATGLSAVMLSGCGRKGDLDTPYDAAVQARKDAQQNNQPVPPEPKKPVTDRKFILDPLI
ncbi:lipoprotein [Mesorhizobium sp. RP14(2022)]|uniref:Lipoprotein n=1 Tax=Mesorhizobium liriopis TaxID=2953882 RepID=A0ABT1CA87_9HYPH|nr:lipoprotein [Mesorhizobium liriopis]MCO6051697.1 lipoprotein [Mesorhizobium liriopis]